MPTYEYGCTSCGQHIEVFQRFSEDPLTVCGNCGGALRKVFHPAGIVFKGSGFYATDSRAKPKTSTPSASAKGSGSDAAGSSGSGQAGDAASSGSSSTSASKEKSA